MTPIGGKYVTEMSIDTDDDHVIMSPYGDVMVRRVLHLTAYYYYGRTVLISCIQHGRREEMVGGHAV